MRIRKIEIAGSSDTVLRDGTPGLPRAFVELTRDPVRKTIKIGVLSPKRKQCTTHEIPADDDGEIRAVAATLWFILHGHDGTNSDVEELVRIIGYLTD